MKTLATILLLALSLDGFAGEKSCDGSLWDLIKEGNDIFLGESHGTVEIPELVQCLVAKRIAEGGNEPLIVALELTSDSLDPDSAVWSEVDGRSSLAMWQLVDFLKKQRDAGKLSLYMMLDSITHGPVFDQIQYEKQFGTGVAEILPKGQVIALSGNFHSRKSALAAAPTIIPAGGYVSETMIRVFLVALKGGETWGCFTRDECGLHPEEEFFHENAAVGSLVSGETQEHDYIFFLEKFTASPPYKSRE